MELTHTSSSLAFTATQAVHSEAHNKNTVLSPAPAFRVSRAVIVRTLLLVTLVLLGIHLIVVASFVFDIDFPQKMAFYFDREANVPTYFSSCLLLFAAGILALIAFVKRAERDPYTLHWVLLALVFLCLSLDEAVSFHELLIEPLRRKFQTSGLLRFPWVVAGAVFALGFGLFYLPFLRALSHPMLRLFIASAAVYVTGVIGLEMVGGYFYVDYSDFSAASWPYMMAMTLEETFEMLGIILFIHTLLAYLKAYKSTLSLTFS